MNVKRLDGRILNFWVAKSVGCAAAGQRRGGADAGSLDASAWKRHHYNPAHDWAHAGPIVSDHWYAIEDTLFEWFGEHWSHIPALADNPLKWFMRAFVATQFGDEVEEVTGVIEFADTPYQTVAASVKNRAASVTVRPWYKVLGW